MSQTELAEALGLQQPAVSKLINRGMPTDIEGARAWRQANIDGKYRPETETLDSPDIVIPEDDDAYATVNRLSLAERQIAGAIEAWSGQIPRLTEIRNNAHSNKQVLDAERNLSNAHLKIDSLRKEQRLAIKALQDAQMKIVKLERDRGNLISLDAAKDFVTKTLSPLLIWIRRLPEQARNLEEKELLVQLAETGLTVIKTAAEAALLQIKEEDNEES